MDEGSAGSANKARLSRTPNGYGVVEDVLGLIGATPLVRLARLGAPGGATVWAKSEFLNPGGSIKDRPALSMILRAEREGLLREPR